MSSGYLDVRGAASSGWAFAYQRILHALRLLNRPEAVEVGEGAFSRLLTGKVCDYVGFSSVSSAATGALAPFRKPLVSLPASAVNAPSLAHICGDGAPSYLDQDRVTFEGLANIYYDLVMSHNDRVYSDFVGSLVESGSFTFLLESMCHSGLLCVYKRNLSLRLILAAKPILQGSSNISHADWCCFLACRTCLWELRGECNAYTPHRFR